jgi:DNA-directed RNA polymerase specialized sigma subunit
MNKKLKDAYEIFFNDLKINNSHEYEILMNMRNMHLTQRFKEIPVHEKDIEYFAKINKDYNYGEVGIFKQKVLKDGKHLTTRQLELYDLYYIKRLKKQQICKKMGIKLTALYELLKRLQKKLT